LGMQQSMIAAQTVLHLDDVPVGTSVLMFTQMFGGALFISVAQNIFTNRLVSGLAQVVPDINPQIVLRTGATSLKDAIDPRHLSGVLFVYNRAITNTFYISVALASLSAIGALGMEWKSVKGKKMDVVAG
jgi:hypothetical protein